MTASDVIDAGADFVVSPITDGGMIMACREAEVLVVPGAFTPTEIVAAWRAGRRYRQGLPGDVARASVLPRPPRRPLPHIRLMPTGGVTLENARKFLAAGACCVGIGTALLDKKTIDAGDWEGLASRARRLVESLHGL